MITVYTGTPGSGKSFHAAQDILRRLRRGGGLICNFPIKEDLVKKRKAHVEYWDNSEMTAKRLVDYALKHHKMGVEGQTLVVIDEAQIIFNCRDFGRKDRNAWVTLFSQHRKLGFNVLLITQSDRMLDKQIRSLIEDEVKHRKLNNYGLGGLILSFLTGSSTWFIALDYWYGGNKLLLGRSMFPFRKRTAEIYDSYKLFSDLVSQGGDVCAGGDRAAVGPQGTAAPPAVPARGPANKLQQIAGAAAHGDELQESRRQLVEVLRLVLDKQESAAAAMPTNA